MIRTTDVFGNQLDCYLVMSWFNIIFWYFSINFQAQIIFFIKVLLSWMKFCLNSVFST